MRSLATVLPDAVRQSLSLPVALFLLGGGDDSPFEKTVWDRRQSPSRRPLIGRHSIFETTS
jgi:hypothetical protein